MPMDQEEASPASSKTRDVIYSISNYEDTRNTSNKPVSHDPADYIQKARVTKAVPPKPAYDPLQFVQLKPCNLVKTAQEQIKKSETVKKVQEEKKEEPEEWQCNLDSWKTSRRKRVEHIIDRVVEVKKIELEEHDRNRRKSKTFNEMMEQRGSRRKYLPIYTDEDNNDLTEFGLGTCDKNAKVNENEAESSKNIDNENNNSITTSQTNTTEYNEYTEAIEGYKSRVSRAGNLNSSPKTESCSFGNSNAGSSINYNLVETKEIIKSCEQQSSIVPKIDFFKRKELFEKEQCVIKTGGELKRQTADIISTVSIKERLSILQLGQSQEIQNENERTLLPIPDASFSDLKNRLEVFEREIRSMGNERQSNAKESNNAATECSTNNANAKTESCGMPPNETFKNTHQQLSETSSFENSEFCIFTQKQSLETHDNDNLDTDREDSGIHTTDVSCSVSQADDQNEEVEQDEENQKLLHLSNHNLESLPTCKSNDYDNAEAEEIYNDRILDDALEMAFQEIDTMDVSPSQAHLLREPDTPFQNKSRGETISEQIKINMIAEDFEPYYQVPKSQEPYYEVPKIKSIPLYENVDIVRAAAMRSSEAVDFTIAGCTNQQPPKEKPPPPPIETIPDDRVENVDNFKRVNSTKRIKNEIRNSRTSFLGIESHDENDDQLSYDHLLKSNANEHLSNPSERNYLSKARSYSNVGDIRDSSVVQNHLHQSSNLGTSIYGGSQDMITQNQPGDQRLFMLNHYPENNNDNLLQRSITEGTSRWLIDNEFLKQENTPNESNVETSHEMEQVKERNPIPPPIPPAKPLRSQQHNLISEPRKCLSNMPNLEFDHFQSFSDKQAIYNKIVNNNPPLTAAYHTLTEQSRFCKSFQALNTTTEIPIGGQSKKTPNERALLNKTNEFGSDSFPHMLRQRSQTECSPKWNVQPTRKPSGTNNQHWLIQEAEQRRIEQQANIYHSTAGYSQNTPRKSLPDSVIQTITQRVQTLGIGTDRRWSFENPNNINRLHTNESIMNPSSLQNINPNESEDKILSVSGKKKCSHCNNELGRGAAMVIESLGLLYHLKCFKCFVCHTRLGDGFNGTDVRVRKYKLHCQNCFSSEDGVKFSCV